MRGDGPAASKYFLCASFYIVCIPVPGLRIVENEIVSFSGTPPCFTLVERDDTSTGSSKGSDTTDEPLFPTLMLRVCSE